MQSLLLELMLLSGALLGGFVAWTGGILGMTAARIIRNTGSTMVSNFGEGELIFGHSPYDVFTMPFVASFLR